MKATIVRDIIIAGSGLEYQPDPKLSERAARMAMAIYERTNALARARGLQASLRRQCFAAGTVVDVLDIYDQEAVSHLYQTQTPSEIVARIRGANWDGEVVEAVVSLRDLAVDGLPQGAGDGPEGILQAFAQWQREQGWGQN